MVVCPACGSENKSGRKFCSKCGAGLAVACAACGAQNEPDDAFCGQCGARLGETATAAVSERASAERRLVSVLFADLVGFTTASDNRDPEETREVLSRYFDSARQVIERYGGTVEKFIGDAVMALWGAPVAQEDDAERAVRAALELVEVVSGLDSAVPLRARAAVVTGEAAVTIGAEGQGLVAGDLVNTASRVQSIADPGAVLVGDATRRATEAAIAYDDAGSHELRGKAEPISLWRARRVVAARRGEGRSGGLEAPFVGREGEFRVIKDTLHASADERKARLVSVIGIGGIGKSRLAWEFEKYVDGLLDEFRWHRGRCLAYGEGVAYWALAEMVRMRAGIAEQDAVEVAQAKLATALETYLPEADERAWAEPRLAQLLGLREDASSERADLFSAWRLFFERLADEQPTILVFEDLQWADAALLDFVEYLLEWSRGHPLFVLTLARPELTDRRPGWGSTVRNFTSLALEPLTDEAMDELLCGLVPGLPDELRARIRERAEGVPLYAVETVRMLLDRGLLRREGEQYVPVGEVDSLDVPETLHALIAARLDGLPAEERRVLEDAAVLGKTSTMAGIAALGSLDEAELGPLLESLVRKDILTLDVDPRSPERGQYGFVQALVQRIAHDTLSRKEQKARHLAAARYLESTAPTEQGEMVEVVAAHYLDALAAEPDAADATELKAKARETLERAGRRAASVAAHAQARSYFEQAAELAEGTEQAALYAAASRAAGAMAEFADAVALGERAIEVFEAAGDPHAAGGVHASIATALWAEGHIESAAERMQRSDDLLSGDEPDEHFAMVAAELGRVRYFLGDQEGASVAIERSLEIAEKNWYPAVLAEVLNSKNLVLDGQERFEEGLGVLKRALELALEHDLTSAALRAYFNLAYQMSARDRWDEAARLDEEGLELAHRRGDKGWEDLFKCHRIGNSFWQGAWDDSRGLADAFVARGVVRSAPTREMVWVLPQIAVARGELEAAHAAFAVAPPEPTPEIQEQTAYAVGRAAILRAEGDLEAALQQAEAAARSVETVGPRHPYAKNALVLLGEIAFELEDLGRVETLVADWKSGSVVSRSSFANAELARFDALLLARRGDPLAASRTFKTATGLLRELSLPYFLAVALLEQAETLVAAGQSDEAAPIFEEAREMFDRLGARPWLDRVAAGQPAAAAR